MTLKHWIITLDLSSNQVRFQEKICPLRHYFIVIMNTPQSDAR